MFLKDLQARGVVERCCPHRGMKCFVDGQLELRDLDELLSPSGYEMFLLCLKSYMQS